MRRQDDRRRDNGDQPGRGSAAWVPVFAILPLILFGLASAAHMLRREAARPVVGDMIVFPPGLPADTTARDMFRIAVPAARVDPAPHTPTHCWLDSGIMAVAGGSLVIEQRLPTDPPWFRLHWIGARTDENGRDCGASATVDVTRVDLRKLATAAGGFGTGRR